MAFDDDEFGYWYYRRPRKRVEGGIKARAVKFGESWWAARWLEALPARSASRLTRGRTYARQGQITEFQVQPGKITGRIQGSANEPYQVTLWMPSVSGRALEQIIAEMKSRPVLAAKLMNREMPSEMEDTFQRTGRQLFPSQLDLVRNCDCPDESDPCKHIAALMYLFSLELEHDPFLLLEFRGLNRDTLASLFPVNAPIFSETAEARPEPLPDKARDFWRAPRVPPPAPSLPPAENAILLKQLGSFPLWRGEGDFMKTLEAVYARATALANDFLSREPKDGA